MAEKEKCRNNNYNKKIRNRKKFDANDESKVEKLKTDIYIY